VATANAENTTFICDNGSAEFGDIEFVLESNLRRKLFVNIEEVNIFCAPFEIVNKLG
jgi:hypothetical protein